MREKRREREDWGGGGGEMREKRREREDGGGGGDRRDT